MLRVLLSIFFVLHGLVHLLYAGQSRGMFELSPGLTWPAGSWAFAKLFGSGATGLLAGAACLLAALGFAAGGVGLLLKQAWWRAVILGAAVFSGLVYLLFWDGGLARLADKGGVGLLINLAILSALLIFKWPNFEF